MKALALVDAPDHVCCRYRIRAFEPALAASGWSLAIESLAPGAISRLMQWTRAARFDTVVLQRKLLPTWQLQELRRRCHHLVFDFDDAVLYRDSYDPRGPYCPRRAARFGRTMRLADTIIAGNDFLADCALRSGARPDQVRVIPTCIAIDRYPPASPGVESAGSQLQLVWIGTSSTLRGLESQRPLWERLGRELPGLSLRLIGDRFARFDPLLVMPVPWSEQTEVADIAAADVGISWVPDDLWSRGKCGLKVLQYQAAGLPVVANPVGVHSEMIESGVNGFLPETADEWIDALRTLQSDAVVRRQMGREAQAAVAAGFSVRAWASTFVSAVTGASSVPPPMFERVRRERLVGAERPSETENGPDPLRSGQRFARRRGVGRSTAAEPGQDA